ncbi:MULTISPECIES: isopentenyl-diphosphate Delta-isomerase [Corynebacterium]|uniref:isopentenyl-diphosphate Delta-isomerase n=1 Tax=Corynebacterium TaxID=1716 RepID=UPI00192DB74A|nr:MULTISPECIES: isopentenyl-diphosphate Delta-isomerase [Corynebacterium]
MTNPHASTDELVVLLDPDGRPVGTDPKATVHTHDTPYHLAFSCYLLNQDGQVLITRRALTKVAWPGVWTNSVCGHPAPGESFADAIRRRARHELGMDIETPELVLGGFSYRAVDASGIVEWEKCPVYVARAASECQPNPDEVCDFQWVEAPSVLRAADAMPRAFSPWMGEQLAHQELRARLERG